MLPELPFCAVAVTSERMQPLLARRWSRKPTSLALPALLPASQTLPLPRKMHLSSLRMEAAQRYMESSFTIRVSGGGGSVWLCPAHH